MTHNILEKHYAAFYDMVFQSQHHLDARRYVPAAVYAQIAASYAMQKHPSIFTCGHLELILRIIGQKTVRDVVRCTDRTLPYGTPRRVLHVLTQALGLGGNTRMTWRWIEQDGNRFHSVALTRQGLMPVPSQICQSLQSMGGQLVSLDEHAGTLIDWARRLRRLAADVDLVVLNIHPNDIIPLLAFANRKGLPPIVLLNQADHIFWLGTSISDLVVNQRESGAQLTQKRRGISPERFGLLPIVVPSTTRVLSRVEAKRQLGLAEDTVMLLSIARAVKYGPMDDCSPTINALVLPDALLPVLNRHSNAVLYVVGPDDRGSWAAARAATGGRVRAMGRREDTAVFYQAADIYLDSFPFTSNTSLLEAGMYATPLVTCFPYSDDARVLGADTPALRQIVLETHEVTEYQGLVTRLIEDENYRRAIGAKTRDTITTVHTGNGWRNYLLDLYQQSLSVERLKAIPDLDEYRYVSDLDMLLLKISKAPVDLKELIQAYMRQLPLDLRLPLWLKLLQETGNTRPGLLLPEWLGVRLMKLISKP
jgi:hypothetical protein